MIAKTDSAKLTIIETKESKAELKQKYVEQLNRNTSKNSKTEIEESKAKQQTRNTSKNSKTETEESRNTSKNRKTETEESRAAKQKYKQLAAAAGDVPKRVKEKLKELNIFMVGNYSTSRPHPLGRPGYGKEYRNVEDPWVPGIDSFVPVSEDIEGRFTVKYAYFTTNKHKFFSNSMVKSRVWNSMWKVNIHNRLKHFLWRSISNMIPTNGWLGNLFLIKDSGCLFCNSGVETIDHMTLSCQLAKYLRWNSPWLLRIEVFKDWTIYRWVKKLIDTGMQNTIAHELAQWAYEYSFYGDIPPSRLPPSVPCDRGGTPIVTGFLAFFNVI
ncbi:hypothetical protein M9H77_13579 [Catharanthus roseus]|uniref:Uncharacterized protein n=1 Tax=Catharanthus roseus TaxID=4058 RepID=A0ACC0BKR7_CATRO|nr:hypothetical protein M9H77_13579 [Catharanthus roseus]